MKVFIHIGDARTGTTTLQSLLTKNRARLLDFGVDYPPVGLPGDGKGTGQHLLAFSLMDEWPKFAIKAKVPRDTVWGEFSRYLEDTDLDGKSLILSSEGFSTLKDEGLRFIKDFFDGHAVTPIFVRRDPEDRRRSMREHRIKRGHFIPEPKGEAPDIGKIKLERWSAQFDVTCIPYGREVLKDIIAVLGVDVERLEPVARENQQFPKSIVELLNSLNRMPMSEENRFLFNRKILDWAAKEFG